MTIDKTDRRVIDHQSSNDRPLTKLQISPTSSCYGGRDVRLLYLVPISPFHSSLHSRHRDISHLSAFRRLNKHTGKQLNPPTKLKHQLHITEKKRVGDDIRRPNSRYESPHKGRPGA
jgi:hypothetical protein